jgi:hypothetical protein
MTAPQRKPRRIWLKIVAGLVVFALLFTGWLLIERYRAKSALAKYEQQLRRQGEKLTIAELIPPAIEGENNALEVIRLCGSFQPGHVVVFNPPPSLRIIAPGGALVITKEPAWTYNSARYTWDDLAAELKLNENTLHDLRLTLKRPVRGMELDYHAVPLKFPHLSSGKTGAQWLSASAAYHLHIANHEAALQDIESLVSLGRLYEHEPIIINQLVNIAIATIALDRTWLALQQTGWTDAQFQRLHEPWQKRDFITPMICALEMERPLGQRSISQVRQSSVRANQAFNIDGGFDDESGTNTVAETLRRLLPFGDDVADFLQEKIPAAFHSVVIAPIWRFAWSYRDEQRYLEILQALIEATRNVQKHTSAFASREALRQRTARYNSTSGSDRWKFRFSQTFAAGLAKASERAYRVETHRQLALTAIALHRYHLRHGKFPDALVSLVPEFLPEHPVDYMDGQKLRYRLDNGTFVLWSVGEDGKDDGGTPDQTDPYNPWSGPDFVWPQPASATEVDQYYERMKTKR